MDNQQGKTDGHYQTSDLYYAAYLKVAGVKFVGTSREGSRVWFLFEEGPVAIRELKHDYYNRKGKVVALTFVDEIRVMKGLTHEN